MTPALPRTGSPGEWKFPAMGKKGKRAFIGVNFKCCKVYSRIYLNAKGDRFVGWCPRCLKKVEILVSKNGCRDRFFEAF